MSVSLCDDLQRLWACEEYHKPLHGYLSRDETTAQQQVEASIRIIDVCYQVALPWRDGRPVMPNNAGMATKRLYNLEQRLRRDETAAKAYQEVIDGCVAKGYARKVRSSKSEP